MNPARSFGPAAVTKFEANHWVRTFKIIQYLDLISDFKNARLHVILLHSYFRFIGLVPFWEECALVWCTNCCSKCPNLSHILQSLPPKKRKKYRYFLILQNYIYISYYWLTYVFNKHQNRNEFKWRMLSCNSSPSLYC